MLDERMRQLTERAADLLRYLGAETREIVAQLDAAKRAWPSAQVVATSAGDWRDRAEPTPKGAVIWATDGTRVWIIWGTGEPIPPSATAVKAWTTAFIPAPPASLQIIEAMGR